MNEKLIFQSDTSQLAQVRQLVRSFFAKCGYDENTSALLVLALDEACTNIIRHAYNHACKPIRLELTQLSDRVRLTLRDYGRTCHPSQIRSRDLEDIRPGGVGVHIIQQAFDHVKYEPKSRGTKLTLEKHLPPSPKTPNPGPS